MSSRKSVLAEVVQLPREEQAGIDRQPDASLDEPIDEDVEASWLAEVERRLHEVEQGSAKLQPWEAVRDRIAARLRAMRG